MSFAIVYAVCLGSNERGERRFVRRDGYMLTGTSTKPKLWSNMDAAKAASRKKRGAYIVAFRLQEVEL